MSTIKVTNLQNPSASSAALVLNTDGTCSQLGVRNAIINGNPIINQRGYVSGTATSGANQYTLDRWRVVTSGQSITWTDSGNVRTVTAPAGGVEQVIEGINLITGTYTLNWTGTATATVAGNAVAKGGNVSITGGTDTTVRFSSGTVSLVQFEPGTVATPFERRIYGQELALCQRYYAKSTEGIAGGTSGRHNCFFYASYTTEVWGSVAFPVPMRASPTVTIYNNETGTSGQCVANGGGYPSATASGVSLFGFGSLSGSFGAYSGRAFSFYYIASVEL